MAALRGATLSERQVTALARDFAARGRRADPRLTRAAAHRRHDRRLDRAEGRSRNRSPRRNPAAGRARRSPPTRDPPGDLRDLGEFLHVPSRRCAVEPGARRSSGRSSCQRGASPCGDRPHDEILHGGHWSMTWPYPDADDVIPEQHQPGIVGDVGLALRAHVVSSVDLEDESVTDEEVHSMPGEPGLGDDRQLQPAQAIPEQRLQPGVGERMRVGENRPRRRPEREASRARLDRPCPCRRADSQITRAVSDGWQSATRASTFSTGSSRAPGMRGTRGARPVHRRVDGRDMTGVLRGRRRALPSRRGPTARAAAPA